MLDQATSETYIKALFGQHAMHAGANMIVQHAGEFGGRLHSLVVAFVSADLRHPATVASGFQHECIHGDIVVRPHARYTDGEHRGQGITGMITGGAGYGGDWAYRITEDGLLVPNT